jgi:hypothetical protein
MSKILLIRNRISLFILTFILLFSVPYYANDYVEGYTHLLSRYVSTGNIDGIQTNLVNYQAWEQDPAHMMAINALQNMNPDLLLGSEKMAFWINAYNLLTIDLIIKTNEKESITNQGSFFKNVWKTHTWTLNNNVVTLDEIEHQILRQMGDPRVHMSINCASLSCPDLRAEPYTAEKLNEQLDDQTHQFINNNTKGIRLNKNRLDISKIFDWFSEDFGEEKGVKSFINKYAKTPYSFEHLKKTSYLTYNWQLNTL